MQHRTRILIANFCTGLTRYLTPYSLQIHPSETLPTIQIQSQKYLLRNWWSASPFICKTDLKVPVFNFLNNQYLGKSVELPNQIFNQPLRRDLIHRLCHYRHLLNKFRTKTTRNRAMTAGSGKKMREQKKTGKARMGDKRAPRLRKGGKAHGAKPVIYSFHLNAKIKLKALCALLTAKLVQGKIKIINQQTLATPKTKILAKILKVHVVDQRGLICLITSKKVDNNFEFAHRKIKRLLWHNTYNLDVKSLLIADKIYLTLNGLQQLINNIRKTKYIIYRLPYMPKLQQTDANKQKKEQEQPKWDPQKPYQFKFRILADYLDLYEKVKKQTPELLQAEFKKIRPVARWRGK